MSETAQTTEEINARLAVLAREASAIYTEKAKLEQELLRRAEDDRGQVLDAMLRHSRFGLSARVSVGLRIRIPDSDWIEDDADAQYLAHAANRAFASQSPVRVKFNGGIFWARWEGEHLVLAPDDDRAIGWWQTLFDACDGRLNSDFMLTRSLVMIDDLAPTLRIIAEAPRAPRE